MGLGFTSDEWFALIIKEDSGTIKGGLEIRGTFLPLLLHKRLVRTVAEAEKKAIKQVS